MVVKIKIDDKLSLPIFQQIVEGLELLILTGELNEGDYLPSVRDFAVNYSVNPNTVSKAYQLLQAKGLVEPVRGLGLVVKKVSSRIAEQKRLSLLEEKALDLTALSNALKMPPEELIALVRRMNKGVKK